jgi:hypothetical protein
LTKCALPCVEFSIEVALMKFRPVIEDAAVMGWMGTRPDTTSVA